MEASKTYIKIERFITKFKGLMEGLGRGFYDDDFYIFEQNCLDEDSIVALETMFLAHKHFDDFETILMRILISGVTFILDTYNNCKVVDFVFDSYSYCFSHGCTAWDMTMNLISSGM